MFVGEPHLCPNYALNSIVFKRYDNPVGKAICQAADSSLRIECCVTK